MRSALLALPVTLVFSFAAGTAFQEGGAGGLAEPGEHHAVLARMVGTWKTSMEAQGMTSHGSETFELRMGGLWLVGELDGEFMGAPFTGMTISGYDPEKEKYVAVWVDSFTASIQTMEGSYDAEADRLEYEAPSVNPMTGEPVTELHRWDFRGDGRMTWTMLYPTPDGAAAPLFAVDYERQ